jgi:penicillin-insensitive murein DD-endopeptidase
VSAARPTLGPLLAAFVVLGNACARAPSPLAPDKGGSIGLPHRGTLTRAASLPHEGVGFARHRRDERHFGTHRLVDAIARAANVVRDAYPESVLLVGDLSAPHGGQVLPHLSHRTGRDADLILYVMTLDGARVPSPGFVHFGADGLAWDETHKRFLRFDVEREWLLVKTLVLDDDAQIQWIFANHVLEAMLIEWAMARGEAVETILRAEQVLLEPHPGGLHDDHVHIRVSCTDDEILAGCEPNGPARPWWNAPWDDRRKISTDELVREICEPQGAALLGARE